MGYKYKFINYLDSNFNDDMEKNFDKFLKEIKNKTEDCYPKHFNLIYKESLLDNDKIKIPDVDRYYVYVKHCDMIYIEDIFFEYSFKHFIQTVIKILLDSEELKKKCSIINNMIIFLKDKIFIYHDNNTPYTFEKITNDIIKKKYACILLSTIIKDGAEDRHTILLLVNNDEKKVNIIDSNGHSYIKTHIMNRIYDQIKDFFIKLNLDYRIINEKKSNPEYNLGFVIEQKIKKDKIGRNNIPQNGYCFFWIIFIFVTYMLNERYYNGDILSFQEDIIDILELENTIYIYGFILYCVDIIIKLLYSFHYELKDLDKYKKIKLYDIYSRQDQFLDIFYKHVEV